MVVPARALNELARILADVEEPVEVVLAGGRNQILFHLDGIDLVSRLIDGQFPNYQQVVPTRTRPAPCSIARSSSGRSGPPRSSPTSRRTSSSSRSAPTASRHHGQRQRRGRRPCRPGRGRRRGRRDDDRLQRALPGRRPDQRDGGPVRARAQRAALAGRLQADRGRPLHPRGHARPDHLLEPLPRGRPARSGPDDPARDDPTPRPPGLRDARRRVRARAAPRLGPERGRQDEPARGDGPARLGPLAPDERGRRAHPLGDRPRAGRGHRRVTTRSRSRSCARARVGPPVASGSGSTALGRRAAGSRRACCGWSSSRPRRCSSSPARRRSAGRRSTSSPRPARRPTPTP